MFWTILHILDILLWLCMAASVAYILFFSLIYACRRHKPEGRSKPTGPGCRFLILYPAYKEDNVIIQSVSRFLLQDYPKEKYHITVISDHQQPDTNSRLAAMPITLLTPDFKQSTKAKALQYAMERNGFEADYVVILDADNVVGTDFLSRLDACCAEGFGAIQCHRCAKNSDTDIAVLDGLSEEINNAIFRKAHNLVGLSSALIGSGMCFGFSWFADHVTQLQTAGEDRELEALLIHDAIYVHYADDILVYDEKVGNSDNFQRQRRRWMSAQINSLFTLLPHLAAAIGKRNINYIDKTIQQMLIPRSLLLVSTPAIAILLLFVTPVWSVKWWILCFLTCTAISLSMPSRMRKSLLIAQSLTLFRLSWKMLRNLWHIDKDSKEFLHTEHHADTKGQNLM